MQRRPFATFDDGSIDDAPDFDGMERFRASSWPVATSMMRFRLEPPKPPPRKPTQADWDVPPLSLPNAPSKRRSLTTSTCSLSGSTGEGGLSVSDDGLSPAPGTLEEGAAEDEAAEEEDEACVFALDGDGGDEGFDSGGFDDDTPEAGFQYQMVGFDDLHEDAKSSGSVHKGAVRLCDGLGASTRRATAGGRVGGGLAAFGAAGKLNHSGSMSPPLGASPVLLSALEQVAAEVEISERHRRGTM